MNLRFIPDIWLLYIDFTKETFGNKRCMKIYDQAIQCLPDCLLIHFLFAEFLELHDSPKAAQTRVYSKLLKTYSSNIDSNNSKDKNKSKNKNKSKSTDNNNSGSNSNSNTNSKDSSDTTSDENSEFDENKAIDYSNFRKGFVLWVQARKEILNAIKHATI